MTNNTNKWMEFSNEYAQLMNENFSVMNKFWNATMEQQSGHTRKNMEMFFEHMNRNAEIMHEIYNNTVKGNEEMKAVFKTGVEKFNTRFQKIYEETMKNLTPKTQKAGQ